MVAADQLTQGDVGGRLRPEDVQRLYRDAYGTLIDEGAVASSLFLDLPSGTNPCAELSAGFGFQAVGATLVP